MSEIELPAYCKQHPDGKLLYILTAEHQESELGCAHCALAANKSKAGYQVLEVKEKLEEYINHADQLLQSGPTDGSMEDPNLATKITTAKDREIARIRKYYDQVIEALVQDRDRHISEIENLSQENLQSLGAPNGFKKPKADIKLNNF